MDMYREKKAQKPFLFFHSREGSTSVFQSVSYPDWFIGTSKMVGHPVILTKERGKNHNTNFYLEPEDLPHPEMWVADSRTEDQVVQESSIQKYNGSSWETNMHWYPYISISFSSSQTTSSFRHHFCTMSSHLNVIPIWNLSHFLFFPDLVPPSTNCHIQLSQHPKCFLYTPLFLLRTYGLEMWIPNIFVHTTLSKRVLFVNFLHVYNKYHDMYSQMNLKFLFT